MTDWINIRTSIIRIHSNALWEGQGKKVEEKATTHTGNTDPRISLFFEIVASTFLYDLVIIFMMVSNYAHTNNKLIGIKC